ncbi:hypothetical protein [Daejeonella sp.]|jgi:hypothetical protein|uniref:hypothetical protein n=1 Tax=Daejeonella sp. TaxID=2805397 RepID=UPI0037BFDA1E
MTFEKLVEPIYQKFLSEKTKKSSEWIILSIAIASFISHLLLIYLVDFGIISINNSTDLLSNPIAAIYTPFSFILLYEVYLLIYYLPKSFTTYIGKQYEIMTLIVIRRLFKDLSNLTLTTDWFTIKYDLQFTYDLATSILMFFLIYLFYIQSKITYNSKPLNQAQLGAVSRFVKIKKILATALVPIFILLAIYSFVDWSIKIINPVVSSNSSFANINNIFFEQFFTFLIFADVILLLFSFFLTDEFHKVIRNSGFIISTILIRLSFSITGLLNNILIVCAIIFGLLIILVHNKFAKSIALQKDKVEKG